MVGLRTGDIGRRNDDGEGLGAGRGPCPGGKGVGLEPIGIDAVFDSAGLIGLFKHWSLATAATRQRECGGPDRQVGRLQANAGCGVNWEPGGAVRVSPEEPLAWRQR